MREVTLCKTLWSPSKSPLLDDLGHWVQGIKTRSRSLDWTGRPADVAVLLLVICLWEGSGFVGFLPSFRQTLAWKCSHTHT